MLIVALLFACTKEPEYPDYSGDKEPVDSGQLDSDPGPAWPFRIRRVGPKAPHVSNVACHLFCVLRGFAPL